MPLYRAALRTAAFAMLTLASAAPLHAQLWYNGNLSSDALSSETNTLVAQAMTYDNFAVTGSSWSVTSVFGDFLADRIFATANFEIRTGMSNGNGGTLLFSGNALAVTQVETGRTGSGFTEYRITIGSLALTLDPGLYWLGIAPIGTGSGRAFVSRTEGVNGVNALIDDAHIFNSTTFGETFTLNPYEAGDFAYGVDGTVSTLPDPTTVPEPSTIALLTAGLAALALTRRRGITSRC